jgi:5S rRNA maturation endonuclease (ribonuclease M5)
MSKIFDIFDYFGIHDYFTNDSMIIGSCPIHQGDNSQAFNINIDPHSEYYGAWFCNTKHCHDKGNDILALIGCLLSTKSNKDFSFGEVLRFANNFTKNVDLDFSSSIVKQDTLSSILEKNSKAKMKGQFTRGSVRGRLSFPCKYYVERGFSPKVLDYFDVGVCEDPKSEMYKRAVFPIYDENDEYMISCVGRTICGDKKKWINKKGFNKSSFLYNYGKAIKEIDRSGTIILVEGQGDVIRLHEAGIKNSVGIFGSHLSDSQVFLLQKSGALNIVIMTDNDDAGNRCREEIKEKLIYSFNIFDVVTPTNDIGDMSIEEINQVIKPQMKGLF